MTLGSFFLFTRTLLSQGPLWEPAPTSPACAPEQEDSWVGAGSQFPFKAILSPHSWNLAVGFGRKEGVGEHGEQRVMCPGSLPTVGIS